MKIKIITHRGLDPDRSPYFKESSIEAFSDQISRGYGLEFDVQFSQDGKMIVIHDGNLKRITGGADERKIIDISSSEILVMNFDGNHLTNLETVIDLIEKKSAEESLSALHIKSGSQSPEKLNKIIEALKKIDLKKVILFDTNVETARYIKDKNSEIQIAASVSHPHDIERYNGVVGGTLISLEDLFQNKNLFSWVWLDEWDLADANGGKKSLYNEKTFIKLRAEGFKIALVTPELHGTSPGLLGGEAHPDAANRETLNKRILDIISLEPDAVCTDHPDYVRSLLK